MPTTSIGQSNLKFSGVKGVFTHITTTAVKAGQFRAIGIPSITFTGALKVGNMRGSGVTTGLQLLCSDANLPDQGSGGTGPTAPTANGQNYSYDGTLGWSFWVTDATLSPVYGKAPYIIRVNTGKNAYINGGASMALIVMTGSGTSYTMKASTEYKSITSTYNTATGGSTNSFYFTPDTTISNAPTITSSDWIGIHNPDNQNPWVSLLNASGITFAGNGNLGTNWSKNQAITSTTPGSRIYHIQLSAVIEPPNIIYGTIPGIGTPLICLVPEGLNQSNYVNGTAVTSWNNNGTSGNTGFTFNATGLTVTTNTLNTTYPAATFAYSGTNTGISAPVSGVGTGTGFAVCMVLNWGAADNYEEPLTLYASSTNFVFLQRNAMGSTFVIQAKINGAAYNNGSGWTGTLDTLSGWTYLIISYSSNTVTIQIGPSKSITGTLSNLDSIAPTKVRLGNIEGGDVGFGGMIADFSFYSRALTSQEITSFKTYYNTKYGL